MSTSTTLLAAAQPGTGGTGEMIAFWVLAPIATISAIWMVLARSAVHAALLLAAVMLSFAGMYAAQDAPFLAAVQVIVYTGAVLMLFLFVLMLVGVDSSDSLVDTLRGQRVAAFVVGLGFAGVLMAAIATAVDVDDDPVGLAAANEEGNVRGIARLLFTKYIFAFEVTSALLITAALGAMVLAHKERVVPRLGQREMSRRRFAGGNPLPLPPPGVYAGRNDTATPALLPDGTPVAASVPGLLREADDSAAARAKQGRNRKVLP